ncbi:MAG: ketoacyl-ACP synthase III [Phycisphaerales bacterium]|nr:MAG: ketoacyl-ACP synthase III [Phycisphaerales bacterium]
MPVLLPVALRGTGRYIPTELLTNEFFASYLDTSDEWITTRTGIKTRHRVAEGEATAALAARAAQAALDDAGIRATDLDVIIVCTATPDTLVPSTGSYVQQIIGAGGVPAFDLSAACSGFLYGVVVAANMIGAGSVGTALVIGAETLTRITDFQDRNTAVLFGDAAGAAVLSRSQDPRRGLLFTRLGTDGNRTKDIWMPAGGSSLVASANTVAERLHYLRMNGREVYKFAVHKMRELIDEALEATGLKPEDIRLVIPHQSNLRIIESVREKMGLPREKIAVNIDRYGNTSAASIAVALDEARRGGQVKDGDVILAVALGAGLTWAATVWRI